MQDLDKLSLEEYLRRLGFDAETTEMLLTYTTNEIDKNALPIPSGVLENEIVDDNGKTKQRFWIEVN